MNGNTEKSQKETIGPIQMSRALLPPATPSHRAGQLVGAASAALLGISSLTISPVWAAGIAAFAAINAVTETQPIPSRKWSFIRGAIEGLSLSIGRGSNRREVD